jgi:acyl carrier protein
LTAPVSAQTLAPSSDRDVLLQLWRHVLQRDDIGPASDFFELGGTSLQAVRLIAEVEVTFGIALRISVLADEPTMATMLREIDGARRQGEIGLSQREEGAI